MIPIIRSTDSQSLERLLRARQRQLSAAEEVARKILLDVRGNGDRALIRYARQLDGVDLRREGFQVTSGEIRRAYQQVPHGFQQALLAAAKNIRAAARRQLPRPWQMSSGPGVSIRQVVRPLQRVVCYVPGGRFPLPSTVLMSVIPAQVAGVREVMVTSPRPAPAVLVASDALGVKRIFRLGGAQAVAAFAYGTEHVPRVDKIVGPGNRYVAAAKKLLAGECGIDFVAGPSELVIVGTKGRPNWIAADLIAQAEHDTDAMAMLITPSRRLAFLVQAAAIRLLRRLRLPVAAKALARHGAIIVTQDLAQALSLANEIAPEHLTLLDDAAQKLDLVQAAGSIFLGGHSPVAAGDYATGTNHILPTGGAARLRGGLSAADFLKVITVQRLTRRGLARLRPTVVTLARTEGLEAHAHSVEVRLLTDDRAT